jgi:HlyD family secretion protein
VPIAETVSATRGYLRAGVKASGRVVPANEVEIKCKASGTVLEVMVDVGDRVRAGDLLVRLDPVDEERSVRRAEAALGAVKARLAQIRASVTADELRLAAALARLPAEQAAAGARYNEAQAIRRRLTELRSAGMASDEELERAEAVAAEAAASATSARERDRELAAQSEALTARRSEITAAERAVEGDTISLEIAKRRLDETRIVAPMDGIVLTRSVEPGQIIASGINNVGGGTTVMRLANLSRLFVYGAIDESDVGSLASGQEVLVTASAFPGRRFSGAVARLGARGNLSQSIVTFEVRVALDERAVGVLKPEMTAELDITIAEADNAILLPSTAVYRRGGRSLVSLPPASPGGDPIEREIQAGASDGVMIIVNEGLTPGEIVLARPPESLSRWRREAGAAERARRAERSRDRLMQGR